jgi:purine-nucleoside phosphorylase
MYAQHAGFTGNIAGQRHGFGICAIDAIYATELVKFYGVKKNIIRIGSCGGLPHRSVREVVVAMLYRFSSEPQLLQGMDCCSGRFELLERRRCRRPRQNIGVKVGNGFTSICLQPDRTAV